jgi:hypothetical protein
LDGNYKGSYLCNPFDKPRRKGSKEWKANKPKIFERMETIAHKSSIYGKVILAKEIDNMTSNFERILIVSFKQHLQWRV